MAEPKTDLWELKRKIEALSPAMRLLMASQLWKKDPEMAVILAENVATEWRAAQLLATIK